MKKKLVAKTHRPPMEWAEYPRYNIIEGSKVSEVIAHAKDLETAYRIIDALNAVEE